MNCISLTELKISMQKNSHLQQSQVGQQVEANLQHNYAPGNLVDILEHNCMTDLCTYYPEVAL